MVLAANLGFPRIGAHRELKKAQEAFWKGDSSETDLMQAAKAIRAENWKRQSDAGIDHIPSNDFSFYDIMLDHAFMFGVIPERHQSVPQDALTLYFAMARGYQKNGIDAVAMEMTKWFDTNYHYLVPEFSTGQAFSLNGTKPVNEFLEAKALGIHTRPMLIGPLTFLKLGKMRKASQDVLSLLPSLLPVYAQLLVKLEEAGATWVQIDEPMLAMDLDAATRSAYDTAYAALRQAAPKLNIMIATYFAPLAENAKTAFGLPVQGVHVDLVRAPEQLASALELVRADQMLSLGVIDGRNIWKSDLSAKLSLVKQAVEKLGAGRACVAPSCSLLHTPVDLANETKLDGEIKNWMAFAQQKLEELALLKRAMREGEAAVASQLKANRDAHASRAASSRIHDAAVKQRVAGITEAMLHRQHPFADRVQAQNQNLGLPLLPTTTIGSFPQTEEIRQARAKFKAGQMSEAEYEAYLEAKTVECIRFQDEAGIDVPVHGEFERNDMVEYFGEQLQGYCFTQNGWVQSYGSRCVKPPVIFGDVSRPKPMTVRWSAFAQSCTTRPMKGMLTGPVTILQWSFVRDDQPRETTCKQIALAIRDEVTDLEKAGIKMIQIDEPAIREGLPLRQSERAAYLKWAVDAFRISAAGVKDATQIHTHMCYSEFNDIMDSVADMDADVISIETSRSAMELLDAFVNFRYPNQIGPGVYDIHSPRVPNQSEMEFLLEKALVVLEPEQVWVNPDCGLKTRGWKEVEPALRAMVSAAKSLRAKLENRPLSKAV